MRQPILFGKYLLLERISVGGMAEVFKAKTFGEQGFEKILAIKRILPSMAQDADFIEMFVDEAKISGQLSHPNIGQIFELGKIDQSYFIAMEYVWGKDVLQIQNRFRRQRKTLPMPMAAFIAARVCEGLDYAHRKKDGEQRPLNIIHRDVSPQNVLVSYSGEVKIIDFGIAKARSRSSKTQAGVLKGKFGYMSPEQVRALPLDHRSDIFSIGTLLFEMTTGERLFVADSDFATLEKVRNAIVPQPTKVNPAIPAQLEAIMLKCLKRDPDERYAWASEVHDELTTFLMQEEPIFSSKSLASALSQLFAAERAREEAAMEQHKRLGKDDVARLAMPSAEKRELAISLLSQGPAQPVGSPPPAPADDPDEDGATQVGGPAFLAELVAASPEGGTPFLPSDEIEVLNDIEEHEAEVVDEAGEEAGDGETSIFSDGDQHQPAGSNAMLAEPTFIFNLEAGKMVPIAEQPTVIFSGSTGEGSGLLGELPDQGATGIFGAGGEVRDPAPAQRAAGGMSPMRAAATAPPSLLKDVVIGVLVALVLIMGAVVWRVFRRGRVPQQPATLVVSTVPARDVEILVDGQSRGRNKAGAPFILERLAPRAYRVAVRPESGALVERAITLGAGQVKVLSIELPAQVAKAHLHLKLDPPNARLFLDGAEVAAGAVAGLLELSVSAEHEVRVEREGFQSSSFTIRLRPGETLEREVKLTPIAGAMLEVTSEPTGANVTVNGILRGKTPLKLQGLPVGQVRVAARLVGYLARTEVVELQTGKLLRLAMILKPQASGGPAAPAPRPGAGPRSAQTATRAKSDRGEATARTKSDRGEAAPSASNVGWLVANTVPWAKVVVDGKDTGKMTPIPPRFKIPLKPGKHTVTFVADGKQYNFPITVTAGEITRLVETLSAD